MAHPAIREAVAVGYPDDRLGERVCAFVVSDEPFDLDAVPGVVRRAGRRPVQDPRAGPSGRRAPGARGRQGRPRRPRPRRPSRLTRFGAPSVALATVRRLETSERGSDDALAGVDLRAQEPARRARCTTASPNVNWSSWARLRNRCRSCSHVKPMPPCTCSALAITRFDASRPTSSRSTPRSTVGVVDPEAPRRPVRARPHALDVDEHVGAPVLHGLERSDRPTELHAVLRVLDRHRHRARPTRRRAARARPRWRRGRARRRRARRHRARVASAPSSSSQPSGRVRSIAGSAGGPARSRRGRRRTRPVRRRRARPRARGRRSARTAPGPSVRRAPARRRRRGTRRGPGLHAMHAVRVAGDAARPPARRRRPARASSIVSAVGRNGTGATWRPSSSSSTAELDDADARRRRLDSAHRDAEPALLDHARPEVGVPAARRPRATARTRVGRAPVVEQLPGRVTQRGLVGGEVEIHRRRTLSDRQSRRDASDRTARDLDRLRGRRPSPEELHVTDECPPTSATVTRDRAPGGAGHRERARGRHLEAAGPDRRSSPSTTATSTPARRESAITFVDGDKGILRYRGIPIEDLVERDSPSFLETSYLLIYGHLPDRATSSTSSASASAGTRCCTRT